MEIRVQISKIDVRITKSLVRMSFLLWLVAPAVFPQAFTANLTGVVTDPAQAAVPDASVKLLNPRGSLQNRPMRVTSKPANGADPEQCIYTPSTDLA
jgi:hypothetical protein